MQLIKRLVHAKNNRVLVGKTDDSRIPLIVIDRSGLFLYLWYAPIKRYDSSRWVYYIHICITLRDRIVYLYASWRVARLSNLNNWTNQVLKAIDNLSYTIKVIFFLLRALWAEILRFTFKNVIVIIILKQYFSAPIKRDTFEFLTALCTKYDYIKKSSTTSNYFYLSMQVVW